MTPRCATNALCQVFNIQVAAAATAAAAELLLVNRGVKVIFLFFFFLREDGIMALWVMAQFGEL